jgi:hypothetical protein
MSIELNIALPATSYPYNEPEVHYISIQRLNLEGGLGTYRIRETGGAGVTGQYNNTAVFPHPYVEGWERCVSRGLAALADARRETA